MSTADPLTLIREYTINNKPVTLLNEEGQKVENIVDAKKIQFDENSIFPRDEPTNFKKTNADDTYTVETLIFLVKNAKLDNSAYFKECQTRGIEHVSIVDRRKILDYLLGKVNESPNVITSTAGNNKKKHDPFLESNLKGLEKRAREDSSVQESTTKKPKVTPTKPDDDSLKIVKAVIARERETLTRSSVMKGTKNFTNTIDLAKRLVLGKEVPSRTSKTGATLSKQPSSAAKPTSKAAVAAKTQKLSSKDRIPLIIVPAAPTAKFTLYNIKQFLEEQRQVKRDLRVLSY